MRLPIDPTAREPLFRQIEAHLRRSISAGRLPPGARLPSTRALARDLGVNRLTVENAYGELVADGLVGGRHGSGTYVLAAPPRLPPPAAPEAAWPAWQLALAGARSSDGRPLHSRPASVQPPRFRLDVGVGDPRLFPCEPFRKALQATLRSAGARAYGYGDPGGLPSLRRTIAHLLTAQGIPARPEEVLVTSGSQRALSLVASLLARPGEAVLVERPTYGGALELFRSQGLRVVGVPTDGQGLQVDAVAELTARHRPRFLYTIPNFQNPTGVCLAPARRAALLAVAESQGLPIVEDDYVGDLRYEGRAQPALKSFDRGGHVIYVSTFSKMLMPGLRAGFLVAGGPVLAALRNLQLAQEIAPCGPIQHALDAYVTVGRYQAHLRRAVRLYRQRRDAMLRAVAHHLPRGMRVVPPHGGLFLWLRLPDGLDSGDVAATAWEAGVGVAPGGTFFPEPAAGAPFLRLCFAAHSPEELDEAVRRLGHALGAARSDRAAAGGRMRPASPKRRGGPRGGGKRSPAAGPGVGRHLSDPRHPATPTGNARPPGLQLPGRPVRRRRSE